MTQEEIINLAAQSFCQVPEVYSILFEKQGQQPLSEEDIQQIKTNPEETLKALGQDKELLSLVVKTYADNQEEIINAIEQTKNNKLFREGGKLNYLARKFQMGGIFRLNDADGYPQKMPSNGLQPIKTLKGGGEKSENDFTVKNRSTASGAKRAARWHTIAVPDVPNVSSRRIGAATDAAGNQYVYERAIVGAPGEGTSTDTYVTVTPAKDTFVNQSFPISSGDLIKKTYYPGDWQYRTILDRVIPTGVFDAINAQFGTSLK